MNPQECISDHVLDRAFAGELSSEQDEAVKTHLGECLVCRTAFGEIEAAAATFGRQTQAFDRAGGPRTPTMWWVAAAAAAAAVVLVAFGLSRRPPADEQAGPAESESANDVVAMVRAKGSTVDVSYFRQRNGVVTPLANDGAIAEGDRVAARLVLRSSASVAWFGKDPQGTRSLYYPAREPAAEFAAGEHDLPTSIEFDDAPGREALFLVVCAARFDPSEAAGGPETWARAHGCLVDTLVLRKTPP